MKKSSPVRIIGMVLVTSDDLEPFIGRSRHGRVKSTLGIKSKKLICTQRKIEGGEELQNLKQFDSSMLLVIREIKSSSSIDSYVSFGQLNDDSNLVTSATSIFEELASQCLSRSARVSTEGQRGRVEGQKLRVVPPARASLIMFPPAECYHLKRDGEERLLSPLAPRSSVRATGRKRARKAEGRG